MEITDNKSFYVIIEAKRGWNLPHEDQLIMYTECKDILESGVKHKAIISMSECSEEYTDSHLPVKKITTSRFCIFHGRLSMI